jgi:hypothetical protein
MKLCSISKLSSTLKAKQKIPLIREKSRQILLLIIQLTIVHIRMVGTIISRLVYGNEIFEEHGQCILDTNRDALRFLVTGQSTLWFVDISPLRTFLLQPCTDGSMLSLFHSPVYTFMASRGWLPEGCTRHKKEDRLSPLPASGVRTGKPIL